MAHPPLSAGASSHSAGAYRRAYAAGMHVRVSPAACMSIHTIVRQQTTLQYQHVQVMFVAVQTWR
jgi:hypothetical protein